jgi:hypothetical protein
VVVDGKTRHEAVKFIEFTDYGRTYDYEAWWKELPGLSIF